MNETLKKLTEETKAKLVAAMATKEIADFVTKTKAAEDSGRFRVVISTDDLDRQGEVVDQNGWDLAPYLTNPVVLWAHDYYSLPIGMCDKIGLDDVGGGKKGLVAEGRFAPEAANPFAQQVRKLYDAGIVRTTSVGFIAQEMQGNTVTKAELLEFSFVPVPANPYALSLGKAQKIGLDLAMLAMKGIKITELEMKGAIPYADHGTAPEDAEWDGAKEVQACGDDFEKLKEICAWYDTEKPDVQASYKLPHHQADGLKAVWKGVAAAMSALMGGRGGVDLPEGDRKAVYDHLAAHYKEFGKDAPEYKAEPPQEGDQCVMEDGSMGIMQMDGNGALVCMPKPKAAQEGDACTMSDGSEGMMGMQDGEMVCMPKKATPSADDNQAADEALLKTVGDILDKSKSDVLAAIIAEETNEPIQNGQRKQKVGRTISEKTKAAITKAIDASKVCTAALEELLIAAEPQGGEGEDKSDGTSPQQKSNPSGQTPVILASFDGWRFNKEALQAIATSAGKALELIRAAEREKQRK